MERVEAEIKKLVEKYGRSEGEKRRLEMDLHFFMAEIIRIFKEIQRPEVSVSRRHG